MTVQGVLLDLSGVVYDGDHAIAGALEAIARLRASQLPIRFVTNTTRKPRQAIIRELSAIGLNIANDELFTPVDAANAWLAENACSTSLLVHPALKDEFPAPQKTTGRAVIIGDAEHDFNYTNLNEVFRDLIDGAELLALAKNRTFKDRDGKLSLDAGPFVAALEFATGKQAVVLGKPAPEFFKSVLASIPCPPENAVMVGDDAEADVAGALSCGLGSALLVRTGKFRDGDEARFDPHPTAIVDDLTAAVEWILTNRN